MSDKEIIKVQKAIIKLQKQIIYELLHDFVRTSDNKLKYVINKINEVVDLKQDLCN